MSTKTPTLQIVLALALLIAAPLAARAETVTYEQNSAGMRDDHDYAVEKAPGTRRLIFTGDFAFGPRLPLADTFVTQLRARLGEWKAAPFRWEVLNVADRACNVAASVARIENVGLAYAPDTVVLVYHPNDAEMVVDTELGNGEQTWLRIRDALHGDAGPAESAAIGAYLTRNGWSDDLAPLRPDLSPTEMGYQLGHYLPLFWDRVLGSFDELALLARGFHFDVVAVILPALESEWSAYPFRDLHARVADAMAARGFRVVDMLPEFSRHAHEALMVDGSGGHPSALASELVAERLEAELADLF